MVSVPNYQSSYFTCHLMGVKLPIRCCVGHKGYLPDLNLLSRIPKMHCELDTAKIRIFSLSGSIPRRTISSILRQTSVLRRKSCESAVLMWVILHPTVALILESATNPGHSLHHLPPQKPTDLTSYVRGNIHICFPLFNIPSLKIVTVSEWVVS